LIHQTKVGLNFIDVYMTSGTYPFPKDGPQISGSEAAGIVAKVGEGVDFFRLATGLPIRRQMVLTAKNAFLPQIGLSKFQMVSQMKLLRRQCLKA
jgi:NADPH:quinone reductase-like Zn-dependent oxidoreductase